MESFMVTNNLAIAEDSLKSVMEDLDSKEKPTQLESAAILMLESAIKSIHAAQNLLTNKKE